MVYCNAESEFFVSKLQLKNSMKTAKCIKDTKVHEHMGNLYDHSLPSGNFCKPLNHLTDNWVNGGISISSNQNYFINLQLLTIAIICIGGEYRKES